MATYTGAGGDNGTGKIQKRREISVVLIMINPIISTRTYMLWGAGLAEALAAAPLIGRS
jgi:hypothetical protein